MVKIKELYKKIVNLFLANTSGIPFLLWGISGLSIIVFVFIFRDAPWIHSSGLLALLPVASIWFVVSDFLKTRKLTNPKIHFFVDSVFYIVFFSSVFYLTGEMEGRLFFITLIPIISAPFFTTFGISIVFTFFLYCSVLAVYFLELTRVNSYDTGVIILQSIIGLAVVSMIGYFLNRVKSMQDERVEFAEKEVEEKTKEIKKTLQALEENRLIIKRKLEELEKFQILVADRELKMMELKEKIKELEKQLTDKK